jgi:hypothetical protein
MSFLVIGQFNGITLKKVIGTREDCEKKYIS